MCAVCVIEDSPLQTRRLGEITARLAIEVYRLWIIVGRSPSEGQADG